VRIGLGSDHAGCGLKSALAAHLVAAGHDIRDYGCDDPSISVDYPVIAKTVAEAVSNREVDRAILVCGTGIGMAIAANKVRGIRAANIHDVTTGRLARQHNDANVVAIGARLLAPALAIEAVDTFLTAEFEPRHQRRLDQITDLERG
jgi:ribose 5-phosphate isomerase B